MSDDAKAGWEVEGFIERLTRRDDSNSERLVLEAVSHLRAFSRDCDALRAARHTDSQRMVAMADNYERLDDRVSDLTEALQRIAQWADAYPLAVFPEPDLAKAAAVLRMHGMTIDGISAHVARHVVEGVGKIAREALGESTNG
jgi:hypothetical protein